MSDGDLILQIGAGVSFFIVGAITVVACVKNWRAKKEPTLKQSPSMEELTSIGLEDPAGI